MRQWMRQWVYRMDGRSGIEDWQEEGGGDLEDLEDLGGGWESDAGDD